MIEAELGVHSSLLGVTVLVDDADALEPASLDKLRRAREAGARLVLVGGTRLGEGARTFELPPLDERAAMDLVRRAVPSLTDTLLRRVVEVSGARPGELRRLVRLIASQAVAGAADIERVIGAAGAEAATCCRTGRSSARSTFLDRGRFNEARAALESLATGAGGRRASAWSLLRRGSTSGWAIAAKRARAARSGEAACRAGAQPAVAKLLVAVPVPRARRRRQLRDARLEIAAPNLAEPGALGAEALAYHGLALSYLGRHEEARATLDQAVELARGAGSSRVEAVALASLGLGSAAQAIVSTRHAAPTSARFSPPSRRATPACSATVQLNLASLLKVRGDIAGAIEHFEAAVDMGRRSGRRSAARHALLEPREHRSLSGPPRARAGQHRGARRAAPRASRRRAARSSWGCEAELAARSGQIEPRRRASTMPARRPRRRSGTASTPRRRGSRVHSSRRARRAPSCRS